MEVPLNHILANKKSVLFTIAETENIVQTIQSLVCNHVGALMVMAEKKLIGIISERDVLSRVLNVNKDTQKTLVREVMTKDPIVVVPDMPIIDAMNLMTVKRIRHLPVYEHNSIIGMISIGDLTSYMADLQEQKINDLEQYIRGSY